MNRCQAQHGQQSMSTRYSCRSAHLNGAEWVGPRDKDVVSDVSELHRLANEHACSTAVERLLLKPSTTMRYFVLERRIMLSHSLVLRPLSERGLGTRLVISVPSFLILTFTLSGPIADYPS